MPPIWRRWQNRRLYQHAVQQRERDLQDARDKGDRQRVLELEQERHAEEQFNWEEEQIAHTKRLIEEAQKWRAPLPPHEAPDPATGSHRPTSYWTRSHSFGQSYLTEEGQARARENIRIERRWVFEQRGHIIAWLSALTGLIAALTGLFAVIYSGR